jgi:hypothetical protein
MYGYSSRNIHPSGYFGLIQVAAEGPRPKLGFTPRISEIPFCEWWEQIVFVPVEGFEYSRKDLIASIADQGGGAHIDAEDKLREKYRKLIESNWHYTSTDQNGSSKSWKINNLHLISLRQIAFEVLNSRELIGLLRV